MKKRRDRTQKMWDLLTPILVIMVILPFIVHLAVYSCGYARYDWYAEEDLLADFYCYYKSYFLETVAIFAAGILIFRFGLYREKTKNMKIYLPLFGYMVFVLFSTALSVNRAASMQGNFESFESCPVLFAYVIISLYAYQIIEEENDYKILWYAIIWVCVVFSLVGILQVSGMDLMAYDQVQKLMMSEEEFALYGGMVGDTFSSGQVYLTLYNPNYAGIVLAMLFIVVFVMCMTEEEKRKKIGYGILSVALLVLVWYTYARASFAALILVLLYFLFLQCSSGRMKLNLRLGAGIGMGAVLAAGILLALDVAADFRYLSRILDRNDREPLTAMTTEADGIHMEYNGREYRVWMDDRIPYCQTEGKEIVHAQRGRELDLPMEKGAKVFCVEGEEAVLVVYLAETTLQFVRQEDGYYYKTESGKITTMDEISSVDFHGLEYLASARGYIWSRVVPLLKDYLLVGSGPDTFPEVFPQEDYAGKIVYSDQPDMVIEKAHNDYLTRWVQTGLGSLLCVLVFYMILFHRGRKAYQGQAVLASLEGRIGYGCYLACVLYMTANLFNDSNLQTSPLFWIFTGIVFASIRK